MKTLRLPLAEMHTQADVIELLEHEKLRPGDTLEVVLDEQTKSIILISVLLLLAAGFFHLFHKERQEARIAEGGRILEDLFASGDAAELERGIEAEYGIEIEFVKETEDTEREDWIRRSRQALAASYGDDEPDYSDAVLLEPNPDFNPS